MQGLQRAKKSQVPPCVPIQFPRELKYLLFSSDLSFFEAFKDTVDTVSSIDLSSVDKDIIYNNSEKFIKENEIVLILW